MTGTASDVTLKYDGQAIQDKVFLKSPKHIQQAFVKSFTFTLYDSDHVTCLYNDPSTETYKPITTDANFSENPILIVEILRNASVTVTGKGEKTIQRIPVHSIEDLPIYLGQKLKLALPLQIMYMPDNFPEYHDLKKLSELGPHPKLTVTSKSSRQMWWRWPQDDGTWEQNKDYCSRELKNSKSDMILDRALYAKFSEAATILGFDPDKIKRVVAISNEILYTSFENHRYTDQGKQKSSPGIFKRSFTEFKNDTKRDPQRQLFLDWYDKFAAKFPWNKEIVNSDSPGKVCLMVHGTTATVVESICTLGFGTVAKVDDGFYGKGKYFTSNLSYASKYTSAKAFVMVAVYPGNVYPVVEHPHKEKEKGFLGSACMAGFNSHFTLVAGKEIKSAFPITGKEDADTVDELVVFQDAQVLPIFAFYM